MVFVIRSVYVVFVQRGVRKVHGVCGQILLLAFACVRERTVACAYACAYTMACAREVYVRFHLHPQTSPQGWA